MLCVTYYDGKRALTLKLSIMASARLERKLVGGCLGGEGCGVLGREQLLFNRRCVSGVPLLTFRVFYYVSRHRDCIDVVFFPLSAPFYNKSVYALFSSSVWGASGPTWIL